LKGRERVIAQEGEDGGRGNQGEEGKAEWGGERGKMGVRARPIALRNLRIAGVMKRKRAGAQGLFAAGAPPCAAGAP
jgi:hypothetical protein